jgi:CBS-domain-containing membrane protein
MFSVYGSSGRLFRGTLEELRQIRPVHSIDRTRSIEPVKRDGRDSALREAIESEPHGASELHRGALAAYQQAAQPPAGQRWGATPVGAVMRRPAVTVLDSATVQQAWDALVHHGLAQAPVVNARAVLVGLVARVDLAGPPTRPAPGGEARAWNAFRATPAAAVMLTPVPSVHPETNLRRAAAVLLESRLGGLPVVDDEGQVTGFVSRTDILRAVLQDAALDQWG